MSIIAEFTVSLDSFALAAAFEAVPQMTVEVERSIAYPPERFMPYVWVLDADPDDAARALDADPTTSDVSRVKVADDRTLFRISWSEGVRETVEKLLAVDPVVLTGTATDDGWDFKLRFDRRDDVSALRTAFRELDADAQLKRLDDSTTPTVDGEFLLTDKQREALQIALNAGYYEIPRETNLSELAADLDISSQALSKRLRRAQATVGERMLTTGLGASTNTRK